MDEVLSTPAAGPALGRSHGPHTPAAGLQAVGGDGRHDTADWAAFAHPATREEMLARWLAILCGQVQGVRCGLVLLASDEADTYTPGAVWPEAHAELAPLVPVAQQALQQRRGLLQAQTGNAVGGAYVAYPVEVDGALKGAIVLDAGPRGSAQWQQAQRQLHWASAWLVDLFRQDALQQREQVLQRVQLANAAVATALQAASLGEATLGLANHLARHWGCQRVSIGFEHDGQVRLHAVSNSASFDRRTHLALRIAEAMDETLDLGTPVVWPAEQPGAGAGPAADSDADLLAGAHAALAATSGARCVWSVPLRHRGDNLGVMLFEADGPLPPGTLATGEVLGELLGPVLALQRDQERSLLARARQSLHAAGQALFGPGRHGVKLLALSALLLAAVLTVATGTHRVSAKTVVEGAVLSATQAPFDGYLAESRVRAGDAVQKGQLLARLDERELLVEQARWRAEHDQHQRKLRQAQAQHDAAAMGVIAAQAAQATAQLGLVQERLQRARLTAPFDGVVVSGDLRQLIGTPVEQGRLLFEIAPLDAYRVVLQVDERDIGAVRPGQHGELLLSGLAGERLQLVVRQVTPVAVAEDGRNFFRVEAQLDGAAALARLRPGLEGIGKLNVGERRLIWIWLHPLVNSLRVAWWRWLP